jgi:putative NADPH-quinone reductase
MSYGCAYIFILGKGTEGFLKEKKALLINKTLPDEEGYEALGSKNAMKKIIDDLRIKWCGIFYIDYVFLYGPARINTETRKKYLEEVYQLGKGFSDK